MRLRAIRALLLVATVAVLAACSPLASKGTMPPPGPNGEVDDSSAPDFIAVAGREDGIAGYARRQDVFSTADHAFPVYGDDLRTVVGQMVPGKGFIPVGVDPHMVPNLPVEVGPAGPHSPDASQVTIYVRNDSRTILTLAVLVEEQVTAAGGYWGQNMGAGSYSMPPGSKLVVLDREPSDPGATVVRVLHTRGSGSEGVTLWIAVADDGSITQGAGVPAWWGSPQAP